jgi:hypothetical protein
MGKALVDTEITDPSAEFGEEGKYPQWSWLLDDYPTGTWTYYYEGGLNCVVRNLIWAYANAPGIRHIILPITGPVLPFPLFANFKAPNDTTKEIWVLSEALMKRMTKLWVWDPEKGANITYKVLMGAGDSLHSLGGLTVGDDPEGLISYVKTFIGNKYPERIWCTWKFGNPVMFTNENYCVNEDGKYYWGHPGFGTDMLGGVLVALGLRFALPIIGKGIHAGVRRVATKRRHNEVRFELDENEKLLLDMQTQINKIDTKVLEAKIDVEFTKLRESLEEMLNAIKFKRL